MNSAQDPVGSLQQALAHTKRLLESAPRLAAEQASEILKVAPGPPIAALYLCAARRMSGDPAGSLEVLAPLAAQQPNSPLAHYEFGLALAEAGRAEAALAA